MAFDVCSGGGASDAGVPLALSAKNGTKLEYLSMYASKVTVPQKKDDVYQHQNRNKSKRTVGYPNVPTKRTNQKRTTTTTDKLS